MKLVIPPPVQGLVIALVMWLIARSAPELRLDFPGRAPLVWLFAIVGVAMEVVAGLSFLRAKTTVNPFRPADARHLVTDGLYRFSRNPMYLAMLLILTAWGVHLANALNLIPVALWVFYITEFQIKPEEEILEDKFGDAYRDYCRRVRRWI